MTRSQLLEHIYSRLVPDPESGCLLWTGRLNKAGYGICWGIGVHRVVWELEVGPIPNGLVLDHVLARGCVHKNCANLAHLEPVTQGENVLRSLTAPPAVHAREYVFHLVRQPRYFSAVDEIREPHIYPDDTRHLRGQRNMHSPGAHDKGNTSNGNPLGKLPGSVWSIPLQPFVPPPALGVDHFAAFPMELPRRIILGWSPAGVCTGCGQGRRPVTSVRQIPLRPGDRPGVAGLNGDGAHGFDRRAGTHILNHNTITGYACACPDASAPTRRSVIVDPFGGTGTTALVAHALGRHGITIDLSADYARLATWRLNDPGERARALQVTKPPPVHDDQMPLFDLAAAGP